MKKYLLSLILSVATFAPTYADGYTGVLVTNGDQKTYYLFSEQPTVRYQNERGATNACLYVTGSDEPIIKVPLQDGARLSLKYDTFVQVNLNSAGYATFSAKDASFIATEGVTAYKAVVDGELITLTALEGNIPAGTGVLLYGETPNTKVNLPIATSGSDADVINNSLKPTTLSDGSLANMEANTWALGDSNQFLRYTGTAFIHNRAYLVYSHPAGARAMRMTFAEDEPTGLDTTPMESSVQEGKYIENGNIVIIRNGMKYNLTGQAIKYQTNK